MWIIVFTLISYLVSVESDSVNPEDEVTFHLYHRSDFGRDDEIFMNDRRSLSASRFEDNLPTSFIIHGWTHSRDVPWVIEMREDWSTLAKGLYTEARIHTGVTGRQLARFCLFLRRTKNISISSMHFIGHSMGAQVAAQASFLIRVMVDELVGRITALDPASPLFEWPRLESLDEIIDPSDASFVDVIHTNARYLGMISPCGHVDYYPNGGMHQPGCGLVVCSHVRACEYWTASVKNPWLFRAISFRSWKAYSEGHTEALTYYPMGLGASLFIPRGTYFLETVDEVPYIHTKTTMLDSLLTADTKVVATRKFILAEDKYNATNFLTLWDFEGVLKYSPLFYGWYTNTDIDQKGYRLPFAYFVAGLLVYAYSFFAVLRKMAENSRMSKLSEKDDECIFSWKLFCAWDYMIGNAETAHNRMASIIMSFKEALLEEAEKKREPRNWRITGFRILVNSAVFGLFLFSVATVVILVRRSIAPEASLTFWRRNELTIVLSLISIIFPMIFETLGLLEHYHPRKQLRIQLARIMVLNLLNIYSLIISLFDKIYGMSKELKLRQNELMNDNASSPGNDLSTSIFTSTSCSQICFEESDYYEKPNISHLIASLALNLSTTAFPKLFTILNNNVMQSTTELYSISPSVNYYNVSQEITSEINYYGYTNISNLTEENTVSFTNMMNNTEYLDYEDYVDTNSQYTPTTSSDENLTDLFSTNPNYQNGTEGIFPYTSFSQNVSEQTSYYSNDSELTADLNITELRQTLIDYMTSLWAHYRGDIGTFNLSVISFQEELYNQTEEPDYYEIFKTTIAPLVNSTGTESEEIFNSELTRIYDEITSTVTTLRYNATETSKNCTWVCTMATTPDTPIFVNTSAYNSLEDRMNYSAKSRLRTLCWETMFGQELVKLTVMDLIMAALSTFAFDFLRGVFVRVMNNCWCWDLEKKYPQYGDFKVAENILHLVNNQGMVWMGLFFSPGLAVLNVIKLYLLMYLRAWTVLTCNVPPEVIFRASRSNNFYYYLLLMMLFLCVLPVGYAIVRVEPSWHCGPFSGYNKMFHIFTNTLYKMAPPPLDKALEYIASPGSVIPLLVLLVLVIYYLLSLTKSLREANADLKIQLRRERTEERRKMFKLADRRRRGGSSGSGELINTPYNKWKKLLGNLPSGKSCDESSPRPDSVDFSQPDSEGHMETKDKDFLSKLIKKAFGKSTSEEETPNADENTDTEIPDSLPDDTNFNKEAKSQSDKRFRSSVSSTNSDIQRVVTNILRQKRNHQMVQERSSDSDIVKHVHIRESKRDSFDFNKRSKDLDQSTTSHEMRQDSVSSNWSDNIPVITISKTESSESILNSDSQSCRGEKKRSKDDPESAALQNNEKIREPLKDQRCLDSRFLPKIKHALQKQSSEVDEDTFCHFYEEINKGKIAIYHDIGGNTKTIGTTDLLVNQSSDTRIVESLTDLSSSEDTDAITGSTDTIIKSPLARGESLSDDEDKIEPSDEMRDDANNANSNVQTESSSDCRDSVFSY